MFKERDLVTRKSHNNDIVFKILKISNNKAKLGGMRVRLIADSDISDLVLYEKGKKETKKISFDKLDKTLLGLVLHIDGDCDYLNECMEYYENNCIPAIGYCIDEEKMPGVVLYLLNKHHPDILVLTGHDGIKSGEYINSKFYASAVLHAREFERCKDSLIIISGGCSSEYRRLIECGSNFASSPDGLSVDVLDPAIIASFVSTTKVDSYVDVLKTISETMNKSGGYGGVDTKGCARKVY